MPSRNAVYFSEGLVDCCGIVMTGKKGRHKMTRMESGILGLAVHNVNMLLFAHWAFLYEVNVA